MVDLPGVLADGPLVSEIIALADSTSASDGMTFGDSATYTYHPGGAPVDQFKFGDVATATVTRRVSAADGFKMHESILVGHSTAVTETMAVEDVVQAFFRLLVSEGVTVGDVVSAAAHYHLTLGEFLALAHLVDPVNNVQIAETMGLQDVATYAYLGRSSITELINATDTAAGHLLMRVVVNESMGLDDDALLRMMYSVSITEGILCEVVFTEPSGAITTWAINTRTNAVTQYTNFAFNSFASFGRKYIAASQSGLYELNGPTDTLNQSIIAIMAGPQFQPNGTKLAGLKGVYLGVGGQGPGGQGSWLLKIITDDNVERVYRAVTGVGMRNTKFDMGKGLKARYFSWELINEQGQDFNFDDIEFIPMMSGRRVGG